MTSRLVLPTGGDTFAPRCFSWKARRLERKKAQQFQTFQPSSLLASAEVGRFFLFALLTWITGNPILAILVIIALSLPGWWAGSRYAWKLSRRMRSWGEAGRLRRLLGVNPHDVKARTELGAILTKQGRYREARAELEQAMPRADDLPEANYSLGLCLLHDGEVEKGRELVEKALVLNPKFGYGEPYLRLGDFRADRGEWDQAAGAAVPGAVFGPPVPRSGAEGGHGLLERRPRFISLAEVIQRLRKLEPAFHGGTVNRSRLPVALRRLIPLATVGTEIAQP